jgi:hypothetical protein
MPTSNTNQRHPDSEFEASYPWNQATITRSGHEIHINDTPGNESLRIAHTTGSYVEIEKTGRWIQTITEKCYMYIKGTLTQTVDSHADVKIGGTYTFNCDAGTYEAIAENRTLAVGGDLIDGVGGVRQVHTESDKYESINGQLVSSIKGASNQNIDGDSITMVNGNKVDVNNGDWSVTGKNVEFNVENVKWNCNDFEIQAAGSVNIRTAGGLITITPGGDILINGQSIKLESSQIDLAGGTVNIQNDVNISGTVDLDGTVRINGVVQTGN